MVRGVGTIIKQTLEKFHIISHRGCGCQSLAARMDKVGPDEIEKNLDVYIDAMRNSAKKWKKGTTFPTKAVPLPPRIMFEKLIVWAISQAREMEKQCASRKLEPEPDFPELQG